MAAMRTARRRLRRHERQLQVINEWGVGVEPIIAHHDLALIRDVGGHAGDELQIIHRLLPRAVPPPAITDLALGFQKRQPLQGEHRPEHVLPYPLGLRLRLGPGQAVDVEVGVGAKSNIRAFWGSLSMIR